MYTMDGKLSDAMRAVRDLTEGHAAMWTRGHQVAVRFSLGEGNSDALCAGMREWHQSVPTLRRDAAVTCSDHHVEVEVMHTSPSGT